MTRRSWNGFARELGLLIPVAAGLILIIRGVVYPVVGLPRAAPTPMITLILLGLIGWFLRRAGRTWRDVGLRRPASLRGIAALTVLLFVTKLLLLPPISDAIGRAFDLGAPDHTFFNHIHGNVPAFIAWIAIAWGVGALAEEMVFRGYLLTGIAAVTGGTVRGPVVGILAQALLFGVAHVYMGPAAATSAGLGAIASGLVVVLARGNLWPAIIVHGVWDSLGVTLLFLKGVV
jgi:hypothetical protein